MKKEKANVKKFMVLSLGLLVVAIFLSACGAPQQYAVMGTSIMAPKPGEAPATAAKKEDIFKGLGEPLKIVEATASSRSDHKTGEADKGEGPEFTIDGLSGTRWSSAYADDQWIMYKLETPKKLNVMIINWEVAVPRKFRILLSTDNANWTEVYSGGATPGKKRYDFQPTDAQYVKLDLIKRSSEWGFSLWEIYVYEAK